MIKICRHSLNLIIVLTLAVLQYSSFASCPGFNFLENVQTQCQQVQGEKTIRIQVHPTVSNINLTDTIYIIELKANPPSLPDIPIQTTVDNLNFADKLIGVALDGYPIYSALSNKATDLVSEGLKDGSLRINLCGGSYGPTRDGIRYHYRVMPSCIYDRKNMETKLNTYISDVYELLEPFKALGGSQVLGYTLDGYKIYSPFNQEGNLQHRLDQCNGKVDSSTREYYATPYFPYLKGCDSQFDSISSSNGCPSTHYYISDTSTTRICVPCPAGRYSTQLFGQDSVSYCNQLVSVGHYAPRGSSQAYPCPAGRYGSSTGLGSEQCSDSCKAGYLCLSGSIRHDPMPCGNASYYCPSATSLRQVVEKGFFSAPEDILENIRYKQILCPEGSYCIDGKRYLCPSGKYGSTTGLSSVECSEVCGFGHYCPMGSIIPFQCPAGRYGGSEALNNSDCSGLCSPGYWCGEGSVSPQQNPCPKGRYGEEYGLTNINCSSLCSYIPDASSSSLTTFYCDPRYCELGYYCGEASTSSRQNRCGSAGFYCPSASGAPILVDAGFYSVGIYSLPNQLQRSEDEFTRSGQVLCEPGYYCINGTKSLCMDGYYGDAYMLTDATCTSPCKEGYYCRSASTSATQHPCGNASVYCPPASTIPIPVPLGYYSLGGSISTRSTIRKCEAGYYCQGNGLQRPCTAGRFSMNGSVSADCDGLCRAGFYCPEHSVSSDQNPCPAGRYGVEGMKDKSCAGLCMPGYYCPQNSTSSKQYECGGDYFYCPRGSGEPIAVDLLHYSTGGTRTTRIGQNKCEFSDVLGASPIGSYRQNICPAHTVYS